jgi:ABC-type multidrug transport system ATPase subunit
MAEAERSVPESGSVISPDPPDLMSLEHVSRGFGRGRRRQVILQDVSLSVLGGSIVQVGGRNGAGKTTLLRVMTGLLRAEAGEVRLQGLRPDGGWREYHRRIGFLSAGDRGLYVRLSVRDHLLYWCAMAFVPPSRRTGYIDTTMTAFRLDELADRRSERLSQGQRQRLRLALAFVHRPSVLLLDEPRNSLDSDGLEILATATREAASRGAGVVWCCPPGELQPVEFNRSYLLEGGTLQPG